MKFHEKMYRKERCMCIQLHTGITSRCISLMQAYYLAKKYQISNMIVIWQLEEACNINYEDVFDTTQFEDINLAVIKYRTFKIVFGEGLKAYLKKGEIKNALKCAGEWVKYFKQKIYNRKVGRIINYYKKQNCYVKYSPIGKEGWVGEPYQKWIAECRDRVMKYLENSIDFCAWVHCGLFSDAEHLVDPKTIIFKGEYYQKAETVVRENEYWVGVHVRRTDHAVSIKESTLDVFIEKMQEILKVNANVKFFLATDDQSVEVELRKAFEGHIFTYDNKIWGRDSKEGMESAIVDCLCLSRCEFILGSSHSVFSQCC